MLQIIRALILFVVRSLLPLRFVEDPNFLLFLQVVDPRIKLPGRTTFTTKWLPSLYDEAKGKLKMELEKAKYVSLTTDGWSSRTQDGYLTVTVHFVTDKLRLVSRVLNTVFIPDSHTAEYLQEQLMNVAREWNIIGKVIVAIYFFKYKMYVYIYILFTIICRLLP